jgi:NAD(P)-dependent dehydrogenase (short-subunit alcohol dehydrogenase family)
MKSVLITGATGGIGRRAVRRLDELGWRVFATGRGLKAAEELAEGSRAVVPIELDVTHEASIMRARDQIAELVASDGLQALINNAGLVVQGPLELVPLHALRRQYEVSVIGTVAVTQAFLPLLRAGHGRVVNIGGAAGRAALPFLGPISAAKASLDSLSDALRMELKPQGIPVSVVVPGLLDTSLHEKAAESTRRDGFAGSTAVQEIYADLLDLPEQIVADRKLADPERAVTKIVAALEAKSPAPRYFVGRDARQLTLLRLLPDRLRDWLLMWNLELEPQRFRSFRAPLP